MNGFDAFMTYFAITVLVIVASVAGLILYVHVYHQGVGGWLYEPMRAVEVWMGGLARVRYIHHTSGIGEIEKEGISANNLHEGDIIIVSGDVGRHGAAILMEREGLGITGDLQSDCATLWPAVQALIASNVNISAMRDATRGGLSAVLNEWAEQSSVCLEIEEANIRVDEAVQGICELFGFEAFDFANEGTFIIAVPAQDAQLAVDVLRRIDVSSKATIIGQVSMTKEGKVILHSLYGSSRYLDLPKGELLPRIC